MTIQLTVRDLCWFITLIAVSLGWWMDHKWWAKREQLAEDTLYKLSMAPPGSWEPIWEGKPPRSPEVPDEGEMHRDPRSPDE